MRFEEILDRELEKLGRTNAELAAASGLGKSTVSRYRRGEREPRWGSAQLWQLAKGLNTLAGGDDHDLEALFAALGDGLSTGLQIDHATYLTRLNSLCRCLNIRSGALARALAYDPSYISRILAGARRPGDAAGFTAQVAAYAARLCFQGGRQDRVRELVGCVPAALETQEKAMSTIRRWLSED